MKRIILLASSCLFVFGLQVFSQDVPQNWVRIESKARDFSVALPEGEFLVDHDGTKSEMWHLRPGGLISVRMNNVKGAKAALERSTQLNSPTSDYKTIESGDFIGRWTERFVEKTGMHTYWYNLASSNGSYLITVNVKKADDAVVERFIRSIRLDGRPLVDATVSDTPETRIVSVESLEMSDTIKEALRRETPKDLKLETDATPTPLPNPFQYTRGAIIFRRPVAAYTSDARRRRVSGSVMLRVTLLANGTIGRIALTKSLDQDLDRQAFAAAKQIKFIPAEMDGKPVDTTVQVSYSFSIY